jgi:hypothetical protein
LTEDACDKLGTFQEVRTVSTTTAATRLHDEVQLQHICSYWATLSPPEVIGPLAEGVRVNVYVTDGEVSGPRMRGRLRRVGGDWLTLRQDGIGILDVRATIELEDGALIYTAYSGVAELGADGYDRFLNGNPPALVPLRITPRYYTAHADYLWINRLQCIGIGEVDMQQMRVSYDIYALR